MFVIFAICFNEVNAMLLDVFYVSRVDGVPRFPRDAVHLDRVRDVLLNLLSLIVQESFFEIQHWREVAYSEFLEGRLKLSFGKFFLLIFLNLYFEFIHHSLPADRVETFCFFKCYVSLFLFKNFGYCNLRIHATAFTRPASLDLVWIH